MRAAKALDRDIPVTWSIAKIPCADVFVICKDVSKMKRLIEM